MTLRGEKMLKKCKSDSAIQLGESCCSDILSDIEGFKKPVEEREGMEKKEHVILQEERSSLRLRPNKLGREKKNT